MSAAQPDVTGVTVFQVVRAFLSGKKTHLISLAIAGFGVLQAYQSGHIAAPQILTVLGGAAACALRAGVAKLETAILAASGKAAS